MCYASRMWQYSMPSSFDLGEHCRMVLLSAAKGMTNHQCPKAFRTSDLFVISKTDLLPYVPFSVDQVIADARQIRGDLVVRSVWRSGGDGIPELCQLLETRRQAWLARRGRDAQPVTP